MLLLLIAVVEEVEGFYKLLHDVCNIRTSFNMTHHYNNMLM